MLREIDFKNAHTILEFGPGNGAITQFILKNISSKTILICFEINDTFYTELTNLQHPQLIVLKASAEQVVEELKKLNINQANYIISSLPLTIIPDKISDKILEKSYEALEKDGVFIQYQYSLSYLKKLKKVFRESISLEFELLNIPPAFIYRCKKDK